MMFGVVIGEVNIPQSKNRSKSINKSISPRSSRSVSTHSNNKSPKVVRLDLKTSDPETESFQGRFQRQSRHVFANNDIIVTDSGGAAER